MKRILYISAFLPFIISSCIIHPFADFRVSSNVVEAGDQVQLTNLSSDAISFEWDFGDGTWSNSYHAAHVYNQPGTYRITLSAYSNNHSVSRAIEEITVLYPTTLDVEVLEYYNKYTVANAHVVLYPSLADWQNMTYPIIDGYTDSNGHVVFSHLDPIEYFLDVSEVHHDNYTLANEDVGFIRTGMLYKNELNTFTAWVDYYANKKKSKIFGIDSNMDNRKRTAKDVRIVLGKHQ